MKPHIVVGLGFGDEGKGRTVSYLASTLDTPLVIKVGGHQAGHTVITRGIHHIFSNIPSGFLDGADSYISEYSTVYLPGLMYELKALTKKDPTNNTTIYINKHCLLTTPYEVIANQGDVVNREHGTCGMGINKTFVREAANYHLEVNDLFNATVFTMKLLELQKFYNINVSNERMTIFKEAYADFLTAVISKKIVIVDELPIQRYNNYIFETGQGILLDQKYGFFPHVTRFDTTSKYGLAISDAHDLFPADIYYVTRTYQTRHGNGPMSSELTDTSFIKHDISLETNKPNSFQGKLRLGKLDTELLNYALQVDMHNINALNTSNLNLVITCMDQLLEPEQIPLKNGISTKVLTDHLNVKFTTMYQSYGAETSNMLERNPIWA